VKALEYYPGYEAASKLADSLFLKQKAVAVKMGKAKLERKDFIAAEIYFTRLHQLFPGDPDILYSLASTFAGSGKSEAAIEKLREAIAKGFTDINRLNADKNFENIPEVKGIRTSLQK
jgi:tetratricopeptide (TPR) repeat protein